MFLLKNKKCYELIQFIYFQIFYKFYNSVNYKYNYKL